MVCLLRNRAAFIFFCLILSLAVSSLIVASVSSASVVKNNWFNETFMHNERAGLYVVESDVNDYAFSCTIHYSSEMYNFEVDTTPTSQTFYYYLPDCTVSYEITSFRSSYLIILPLSMDNPSPIQITYYEQLPSGAEHEVTGIIPIGGQGVHFSSTSYPSDITMIELNNVPVSTPPCSSSPSPTPIPTLTHTEAPTQTPSVPELSLLIILPLLLSIFTVATILKYRKTASQNIH